jgi:hypothetical protein
MRVRKSREKFLTTLSCIDLRSLLPKANSENMFYLLQAHQHQLLEI